MSFQSVMIREVCINNKKNKQLLILAGFAAHGIPSVYLFRGKQFPSFFFLAIALCADCHWQYSYL